MSNWGSALNNDPGLYFCPTGHKVVGNYKIQFYLSGTYDLLVSDAVMADKSVLLFEYIDEDDDRPAEIGIIETDVTMESMIEHLKSVEAAYHGPIYESIFGWALKLFCK